MSLEIALQENTAAIRELIARLATAAPIAEDLPITKKTEPQKPAATQPAAETQPAKPAAAAESPSDPIDYTTQVKPLLLKVSASKGRDALVTLLAKFGVDKGDKLPADKLGDVLVEIETLLAA